MVVSSNQEVDLDKAVSMKNAGSGGIYERFSSVHYSSLVKSNPEEAAKYIALFNNNSDNDNGVPSVKSSEPENVPELEVITDPELQNPSTIEELANRNTEAAEKEILVQKLRKSGMKLASIKRGIDTLRKKVADLPRE